MRKTALFVNMSVKNMVLKINMVKFSPGRGFGDVMVPIARIKLMGVKP